MRNIVAAILGTAVVFVWGGVAWVGLDIRVDRMKEQPTPDVLPPAIRSSIDDSGACVFSSLPDVPADADGSERTGQRKAWADAVAQGPVGVLLVRPEGVEPRGIPMIVLGIAIVGFAVVAVVVESPSRNGRHVRT